MSRVIIDGDKTILVKDIVEKIISTEDFLEEVSQSTPIRIPFLPSHTKGLLSTAGRSVFIIEQPARTGTFLYQKTNTTPKVSFEVHYPWIYYGITIQNKPVAVLGVRMGFATKRVTAENSPMGMMTFSNLSVSESKHSGLLCLGEIRVDDGLLFHQCVDDLVAKIIHSPFNGHIMDVKRSGITPDLIWNDFNGIVIDEKEPRLVILKEDEHARFHYAWETVSKKMTLEEFLLGLTFKVNFTYKEFQKDCHQEMADE